jgi:hypothetical protein
MSEETFQCLTVRQPWAWAIVSGAKDVENRSWKTEYRGPIIIHASATKAVVNRLIKSGGSALPAMTFTYGSLIGIVDLVDVVPLSEELETNPWAWGPYCWRISNPRRFTEPIPGKGKLKLYTLPPTMSPRIRAAVTSAREPLADVTASAWVKMMTHLDTAEQRHVGLFDSYMALADVPGLTRLAERAIAERGDGDAFVERSVATAFNEDYSAALTDANHAIALDSLNERAFRIRSRIYQALDKPTMAEQDRRRADELGESNPTLSDSQVDEGE